MGILSREKDVIFIYRNLYHIYSLCYYLYSLYGKKFYNSTIYFVERKN